MLTDRLSHGARRPWILSAAALALIAILAVPSFAAAKVKTFSSGPVGMPIPDAVGQTPQGFEKLNNFRVKTRGTIKDVDVAVRVTHPDSTDLTLGLYHRFGALTLSEVRPKDGTALSPDYGAGASACAGAVFTTFDDEAPLTLETATSPFAGRVRPEQALRQLDGGRLQGGWQLGLLDGSTSGAGTLDCWRITVRYKPLKQKQAR